MKKIKLELSTTEILTMVLCMRVILDISKKVEMSIEPVVLHDMQNICDKILATAMAEKIDVN